MPLYINRRIKKAKVTEKAKKFLPVKDQGYKTFP